MYLISNHSQYRCRSQTLQMWLQQLLNGNRMPSTHLKDCKITFGRKCSNSKLKHHSLYCSAFAKKTGKTYHVIQAFTSNSALKTHQMVHTREKPFQVCSRCYVRGNDAILFSMAPIFLLPGVNVPWLATKPSKLETFLSENWKLKISPSSVRSVVLSSRATLIWSPTLTIVILESRGEICVHIFTIFWVKISTRFAFTLLPNFHV